MLGTAAAGSEQCQPPRRWQVSRAVLTTGPHVHLGHSFPILGAVSTLSPRVAKGGML